MSCRIAVVPICIFIFGLNNVNICAYAYKYARWTGAYPGVRVVAEVSHVQV